MPIFSAIYGHFLETGLRPVWALVALFLSCAPAIAEGLPLGMIQLPEGFEIEVFSDQVPNARQLAISPAGTVFAGSRREGKVYAIVDRDGDWRADNVFVIASGLTMPSGVAFRDGALYVAAVDRLLIINDIEERLSNPPPAETIVNDLPDARHHGWRYIKFGADGRIFIPIGIPCNACETDAPFGQILSFNPDGHNRRVIAEGIRSVQGLDWHPATGELWFSDNGRDHMGDDTPPDEINRLQAEGDHFGAPRCHGGTIPDPDIRGSDCEGFSAPEARLPAHVAPLGIVFYDGGQFPQSYVNRLFVVEHGSWNRSTPVGYRITMLNFDGGEPEYQVFADGWLSDDGEVWGRPADIVVAPDGSLLVSDDRAGAIYRIFHTGER